MLHDYRVSPNGEIKIFDAIKINKLCISLDAEGVEISAINSSDESVEDYYLNLIREAK